MSIQKTLKRGFTLIELLVVIGIMLLIMAIALPGVSQFMATRVYNQAAQIVQEGFIKARSRAITQRDLHYVVIITGAGSNVSIDQPSGGTRSYGPSGADEIVDVGTVTVVDSGEKEDNVARQMRVAENLALPDQCRFHKGYNNFYVKFFYDGSCAIVRASPSDRKTHNMYVEEPTPDKDKFDLIILGPEEDEDAPTVAGAYRRLYFDIIQGSGQLKHRIHPK